MKKRNRPDLGKSALRPVKRESRATMPEPIKAKRPSDFVVLVPYLMGFQPQESLVAMLFDGSVQLLTARVDLVPADLIDDLVEQVVNVARRQPADRVMLLAYSVDAELATTTLDRAIERIPLEVIDALYADGSRWWSRLCSAPDCCPDEGTPYDISSEVVAAEAVFAGLSAEESREAVARRVLGPPEQDAPGLRLLAGRIHGELNVRTQSQRAEEMSALVDNSLGQPDLDDETCARLAALCVDLAVRDVAWAMMTRADAALHVDLWQQVVSRTAAPYESAPICLLGMAGWISGNGALQVCCIERMQKVNKGYGMAGLLDDINRRALAPSFWDEFAEAMRGEGQERDELGGRGEVEGLAG